MDEAALIEASGKGDVQAQRAIYERYIERLYRLALRLTGNEQDAFDVSADAFVRAFRQIAEFNGRSALGTWLHRIVVNEALQLFRRRSTQARHAGQLADLHQRRRVDVPPPGLRLEMEDALGRVSPEHRAVLLLKYHQGLDYAEIAEVLECEPGTVASRLNRARAELRRVLEAESAGPSAIHAARLTAREGDSGTSFQG